MQRLKRIGTTFYVDTNKDVESIKNCVYMLRQPNLQVYIGSTNNLINRLRQHAGEANNRSKSPLSNAIRRYKNTEVKILGECETIEEARWLEREMIRKASKTIYKKLGSKGDFEKTVKTCLLNRNIFLND